MNKRGVGAVLQQATNQVGQQIAMGAHGCVDPHRRHLGARGVLADAVVRGLAHAVQALPLVVGGCHVQVLGQLHHRCHGDGVVGGELRPHQRHMLQQLSGAGQVGQVGVCLAGVDRVAGQAQFLGPLDLAIPIRALDQAHRQAAPVVASQSDHLADHRWCPQLVGLHGQAQARPGCDLGVTLGVILGAQMLHQGLQHAQLQRQPVRLFSIQRQQQLMASGQGGERGQSRQELANHLRAVPVFKPGVQGRELDRHALPLCPGTGMGQTLQGMLIGGQVAVGIGPGARSFAQHVKAPPGGAGVGAVALGAVGSHLQSLFHAGGQHELPPQQLHGLQGGVHRGVLPQSLDDAVQGAAPVAVRRHARMAGSLVHPMGGQ